MLSGPDCGTENGNLANRVQKWRGVCCVFASPKICEPPCLGLALRKCKFAKKSNVTPLETASQKVGKRAKSFGADALICAPFVPSYSAFCTKEMCFNGSNSDCWMRHAWDSCTKMLHWYMYPDLSVRLKANGTRGTPKTTAVPCPA